MRFKTYADIAAEIEVNYCGENGAGHETGYASMDGPPTGREPIVHWAERRVTRSGIKRFLMLAYEAEPISYTNLKEPLPGWLVLWLKIKWVRETARDVLHTTIPVELWAEEKARLLAKMTNAPWRVYDSADRVEAMRWARR